MSNLPIFRAKKIDSDEYVEGYLFKDTDNNFRITNGIKDYKHPLKLPFEWLIDPTTKSIHFPDMLDSQGNKIFASLQKDGKGGDILNSGYGEVVIAIYEEGMIKFRYEESLPYNHTTINEIEDESFLSFYEVWQIRDKLESEIVGIQE